MQVLVTLLALQSLFVVSIFGATRDINQSSNRDDIKEHLLHAVQSDDVKEVVAILNSGGDPNSRKSYKNDLIDEKLVADAANVAKSDGPTALMLAALIGSERVTQALINKGADVNKLGTCLETTNVNFDFDVVKVITIGGTALHVATRKGHLNVVKLLLRNRANVRIKDSNGKTALDYARAGENSVLIRVLLQAQSRRQKRT